MSVKMKRRICSWVIAVVFFLLIGIVGGVECGTITLARGAVLTALCLIVEAAAAGIGGYLK